MLKSFYSKGKVHEEKYFTFFSFHSFLSSLGRTEPQKRYKGEFKKHIILKLLLLHLLLKKLFLRYMNSIKLLLRACNQEDHACIQNLKIVQMSFLIRLILKKRLLFRDDIFVYAVVCFTGTVPFFVTVTTIYHCCYKCQCQPQTATCSQ